jgi:predicted nucleotidyltransferase component of viral defense system
MRTGHLGVKLPDMHRPGSWAALFRPALKLMAHLEAVTENTVWTFGGGTALMLRINHRQSKDIDLFVPDPQYLGYVNPRLSDAAESISDNYVEDAQFIKLFLPEGEIDIVVGTSLTEQPWEMVEWEGRPIRIESSAEIIAKKMWHRGHFARARDLFDLCAVADAEPSAIGHAQPFMARHARAFLDRLHQHRDLVKEEFEQIDRIDYNATFEACIARAEALLGPLA